MDEVVNICKECGIDFFSTDPERMLCHPCIRLTRNVELKLFECRILWKDGQDISQGISRFTLLHTDKSSAEATIYERLSELGPKDISKMVITELPGPFKAGDFIHQELQYMSPSEFSTKDTR